MPKKKAAKKRPPSKSDAARHRADQRRALAAQKSREDTAAAQEIGKLPKVADRRRRTRCAKDLATALKTYFPQRFQLSFSDDHLQVIQRLERSMKRGGLFAVAMPRGYGKTTLCDATVILAILYGHHSYVAALAATQKHARKRLAAIKKELLFNDLLLADFPEAIYPIRQMKGIGQKCRGQTYQGAKTDMTWGADQIVMPTIPKSPASAAVVECGGLLSAVRGMNYTRPDGRVDRPTFALIDDPQTTRSAKSNKQSEEREDIISNDVLYLSGPGKKISGVMPCTVIVKDDLADRMLDGDRNPEWQGIRTQMVKQFPTNMELWDKYAETRAEELRHGGDGSQATKFYKRHRKKMDAGAEIAWPDKFNEDELSAVQNAMNLMYRDRDAFMAEMQNDPRDGRFEDAELLTADQICQKVSGYGRRKIPSDCTTLTSMVDVQQDVLFWLVAAWGEGFTGHVLDYGSWPEQGIRYYEAHSLRKTLSQVYRGRDLRGRIFAALQDLEAHLFAESWQRDDGVEMKLDQGLVDGNWEPSTESVYSFCRQSVLPWLPSHGRHVGAKRAPLHIRKRERGDIVGRYWRRVTNKKQRARCVEIDTNAWKSHVQRSLLTPLGARGSLSLYKASPRTHRLIADHFASEYRTQTSGPHGDFEEWELKPGKTENHWLDGIVGAAVAASIRGVAPVELGQPKQAPRRRKRKVTYL